MYRPMLISGAFFAGLAVMLGAFGAHGLEDKISEASIDTFKTGVTYQFYHAFALLFCSLLASKVSEKGLRILAYIFEFGMLFFCGSLYILSTQSLTGWNVSWAGPITPLGGLFFISGWIYLIILVSRVKKS